MVGLTPQSSWEGGSTPHAARAIEVVSESLDQKHMRPDVSHNSTYYIFLILLGSKHFEKPVDRSKQIARFVLSLQLSIVLENRDVRGRGSNVRTDI